MYYVYIIFRERNEELSFYTGQTNNLEARWKRHKNGYTKANKSFNLMGLQPLFSFNTLKEAMRMEKKVKHWTFDEKLWWYDNGSMELIKDENM